MSYMGYAASNMYQIVQPTVLWLYWRHDLKMVEQYHPIYLKIYENLPLIIFGKKLSISFLFPEHK